MAGSSLSPRQKMINMMYLVLTALLALNVSAEILQAFESLRASLQESAELGGVQNESLASDIIKTIENQEKGNNHKYSHLKPVISDINLQAANMIAYLDEVNAELERIGDQDPATGDLKRKDETNENYRFWLGANDVGNGGRGDGKAQELHAKLDAFHKWANDLYTKQDPTKPNHFTKLVLDPKDDPKVTDPESRDKTWEYFTFHGKPVIADMALIQKFKMDVRSVQADLLNQTKGLVDDFVFTIDSLIAVEAPSALVVAAGMKYTTKLSVGIASSSIKPEFVGPGVAMDAGGSSATMTINANGAVIPEGKNEGVQNYSATIKVPRADGSIQTLPLKGSFTVRKPEVVVRSKALQILYKDCGNTVDVDVPALGDGYNPDFSKSKGGAILKSATRRSEITIVPTDREFLLSIYSNTNGQSVKIDNLKYNVIKPAQPRIGLFANGQEINGFQGVSKRQTVTVKLLPDPEFARTLPRDARYRAEKVTLMIQDGIGPPKVVASVSGADIQSGVQINLNQGDIRNAYPGAKIYFEVVNVKRMNFQNKVIEENLPRTQCMLAAVIRG